MRKKSKPGIREIAERTNLNISTVSRALNYSPLISPETTSKVLRAANELGYHQHTGRKKIIVVLPPYTDTMAWYALNLINALQKVLGERKYYWEYINVDYLDMILERSVSGIISMDYQNRAARAISKKFQLPLVCINDASAHLENAYSVNSDSESGISLAFQCLFDNGHRRIAFLSTGGENSHDTQKRKKAFFNLAEKQLMEGDYRCVNCRNKTLLEQVQELYADGFTGLISDGESRCVEIVSVLQASNIQIPSMMSLVTWELPHVSGMLTPRLTTLEQDFAQLAEKAVELLELQWKGEQPVNDVPVPFRLILRNSVAPPPETTMK